ncbi:sensor histidine kinase [Bordetella genomosp. 13]|uniref:sensor histidine kinase n=1 Tax=Bordetella genomosp. 13 TaxID=463040 RepID=UPI0021B689D1|nr:histidine kinase [Bordetella genomosp. 13]
MLNGTRLSPFFWRAQATGWLVLGAVGFFIRYAAFGHPALALGLTLTLDLLGFLSTTAAAALHARYAGSSRQAPVLAAAAVICVGLAGLFTLLGVVVQGLYPPEATAYIPRNSFMLGFVYYLGIFSIWTLVYLGFSAELDARAERLSKTRAETRALQLELEHLQRQIAPHFLFNSLNTILGEIAERPTIAEEMTRRLAAYLRYSFSTRNHAMCSVDEEVAAVRDYVGIQALRFDERFACHYEIDPAAREVGLPHMTLQGLVENALKHGMRNEDEHFSIHIRARMHQAMLVVEVDNPGQLAAPFDALRPGVGLGNLRQRLALRYPGRHSFTLEQRGPRTVARLTVEGEPCYV